MVNEKRKQKILCLHGYRQNAESFRQKTGSLRKLLKSVAELEYMTAPHEPQIESQTDDEPGVHSPRGWWFSKPNAQFNAHDETDLDNGFKQSLDTIASYIQQHGPYDGILGFSQGAQMAHLFCLSVQRGEMEGITLKFGIFIANFQSKSSCHSKYYSSPLQLPCLHVFGQTDRIIPQEMSEQAADQCENGTKIVHPGGHLVPSLTAFKPIIRDFFDSLAQ